MAEIVELLSNLKVVELAKLKTLLEETWGVTAAAPAAIAVAAAPAGDAAPAAAEATDFQITLTDAPADKKIGIIKVIREVTGLGLKEAKDIADAPPKVIKETAPKAEAEDIKKKFEAAGAKVTLKGL
ncbi:MAG: 50S ribosomal protein L7/L12 [Verrucomicrobia bacterium]|nr:50S ribosomal protein L7/L12 [Verrucomicrobiota bacterium]MBS0645601.1 50S ribosomal protein L7/L12 [Verrucomicrobiota bacterium]